MSTPADKPPPTPRVSGLAWGRIEIEGADVDVAAQRRQRRRSTPLLHMRITPGRRLTPLPLLPPMTPAVPPLQR